MFGDDSLLLGALELLNGLLWRRQVLGHRAAQSRNRLTYLAAHGEMSLVGIGLIVSAFTFQLGGCLCGAEDIAGKLLGVHPVEDFLAFRQTLARGNVTSLLATVKAHIAEILEDGEVALGDNTRASGGIGEGAIPVGHLATQEQPLLPFWQLRRHLIKTPRALMRQPLLDRFGLRAGHALHNT